VDPEVGSCGCGDLFAQAGKPEEMSPGMEGNEICANGKKGGAEKEQEDQKAGLDPVSGRKLGKKVEKEGKNQKMKKRKSGLGAGLWRHEENDLPSLRQVEGKGGKHDESSSTQAED